MPALETALSYRRAGLCVLPADAAAKRPAVGEWKQFQQRLPTEEEVHGWFGTHRPMCLVAGAVSGNLELLDFDCQGVSFQAWRDRVEQQEPKLLDSLVLERSPSGGFHAIYRCQSPVCGNIKLAERAVVVPGSDEVELYGKKYKPRRVEDRWEVWLTLIETRGEGGIFLCDPSPGYQIMQGWIEGPPVLTDQQREILLEAAWSLNKLQRQPEPVRVSSSLPAAIGRPGDDYNSHGDVRAVLQKHGWTLVKQGDNELWRRPGKTVGWSATLKNGVFFTFTSNGQPFEPNTPYGPFAVYAMLEHGGDYAEAASALRAEGFGSDEVVNPCPEVDLSCFGEREHADNEPQKPAYDDPGPLPAELLRVPGFVSELMDHSLASAPYPNTMLAFCGALTLQAFLGGRRVRDQADNRTNIYLLGLAYPSAGKDWPRKINARLLHEVGLSQCLGDGFASGEGIQDILAVHKTMLFQTDEIDGLLNMINSARDHRHENLMNTLLRLYSSSNSMFAMRPKAGRTQGEAIDQPCMVVFGTAVPTCYYQALSERMLTNGFFARMIVVEGAKRAEGQEPKIGPLPPRILETAHWWAKFNPGNGNLEDQHPEPVIIEYTPDALHSLVDARIACDKEYALAEARGDAVATTVWGRVNENSRKLALLYAISRDHRSPKIDQTAVDWATQFVTHHTRRMLFMSQNHVSDNPFHADCLRLMQKLRNSPDRMMSHSQLLKRMKMDTQSFQKLVQTLSQQGDIEMVTVPTAGRPRLTYQLLGS